MHDGDTVNGELRVNLSADFADFGERHRFVGFVVEIERAPAVRMVADTAVEGDDGTVFGGAEVAYERGGVDRFAAEMKKVVSERVGGHSMRDQPPLTGGRKAISSPASTGVVQAANSWLREAASDRR